MSTFSLADLAKANKLNQGLPEQDERMKFKQQTVLGRDGIYLSYLSDFFDVVYQIEKFNKRTVEVLGNVGVPEVQQRFQIKEKIPSENIHKMVAWYRYVTFEYGTEATMQVFYDKTGGEVELPDELADKYEGSVLRDGNFVYIIPEQNVTGGFVSFHGRHFPETMNGELYEWALANFDPVLNIHSHNTMSAFWSGTDDDNELPLYNRLCLVIGKLDTDHPKFRFSWNFEGKRHDKESVIDDYIKPLEIRTAVTGLGYEEVSEKGFNESLGYLDYDKVDFDKRWDERIRARGRYGNNRGKFKKITELSEKETKLTAEESRRIQMEVGGVESQKEQDEFYDDNKFDKELDKELDELELSDIEAKDQEETNYEDMEDWKKDLLDMKNKSLNKLNTNKKVSESKNDSDETKGEQQNANSFRRISQRDSGKHLSVFQKFQRDRLAKEKEQENSTKNSSIWDDVER